MNNQIQSGIKRNEFKEYLDYSIGFCCYDKETQVLTENGWKYFHDLDQNEKVMTLNPNNNQIEYHVPNEHVKVKFKGDLIHFKNKYVDLLVTPNHKMYVNKHKKFELIRADEIEKYYQYRFKKDAIWNGKEQEYFNFENNEITTSNVIKRNISMDLFLEFMGYFLSEGNTQYKQKTNSYIVRIAQKKYSRKNILKGDVYEKIENCVKALGYKYYSNENDGIAISNKQLYEYLKSFGLQHDRYVPTFIKTLSKRQINIFLEAYIMGDGVINVSRTGKETRGIISNSKHMMDDLQELFLKIGVCGDIKCYMHKGDIKLFEKEDRKITARHNVYSIYQNNHYKTPTFSRQQSKVEYVPYDDFVYCVEVTNHILYVRRNDIATWCGNTRGCFRKCGFCVNKKYDHVFSHSPLDEFYDPTRKKICLLDDNFFGFKDWKSSLQELQNTKHPFKFKQGMDERILNDEKCEMLFGSKYDGSYTFAFDNIDDKELIEKKLQLIRKHTNAIPMFYVLCGFDKNDRYDDEFWENDILNTFERIQLLMKYHCLPYIMRFNRYEESPHRGMYINLARWCNQPNFLKKKSFYEFCTMKEHINGATNRYMNEFKNSCKSEELYTYFDMKWAK